MTLYALVVRYQLFDRVPIAFCEQICIQNAQKNLWRPWLLLLRRSFRLSNEPATGLKRRQRRPEIEMLRCTLVHAVNISSAECAFPRDSRNGTIGREKITDCQLQSASSVVSNPVYTIQHNRFDNRLYRVNKHPTGCQTGFTTGCHRCDNRFDNRVE